MKQSIKLKLTKQLMAAIVSLKKAEKVLHAIDEAVGRAKAKVARFSEDIESTARHIKESEAEHKKSLLAMNGELDRIRSSLAKHEKRLSALAGRRGRVVAVVAKWRKHVATLRDAHEAYTANLSGAVHSKKHSVDASLSLSLTEPPAASKVLAELGIPVPAPGGPLRGKGQNSLDSVLKAATREYPVLPYPRTRGV